MKEKKPWTDEVDHDKNLNRFLSQHLQEAADSHITGSFPLEENVVLKYL